MSEPKVPRTPGTDLVSRLRAALAEAIEQRDAAQRLADQRLASDCDKVLAMTDEQVGALCAVQGSSADIDALKGQIALVRAQLTIATAERNAAQLEVEALQQASAVGRAIYRAADTLPEGYTIEIFVERDAGWVELSDADDKSVQVDDDDMPMDRKIDAAIDAARGEG